MTDPHFYGILRMLLIIVHLEIRCTFAYAEGLQREMSVKRDGREL